LAEFISAVDEICVVDNFAKNEGIFLRRHITLISVTPNGVIGKLQEKAFFTPIGVTPNGATHRITVPCSPEPNSAFEVATDK